MPAADEQAVDVGEHRRRERLPLVDVRDHGVARRRAQELLAVGVGVERGILAAADQQHGDPRDIAADRGCPGRGLGEEPLVHLPVVVVGAPAADEVDAHSVTTGFTDHGKLIQRSVRFHEYVGS